MFYLQIGVGQFLAQHDPDVDAIYRLTAKIPFNFRYIKILLKCVYTTVHTEALTD